MGKLSVGHLSAVGIIYKEGDPSRVFFNVKDGTYPTKIWRGHYCFIGGNWIGQDAAKDASPRETFVREVREELSLAPRVASTVELSETAWQAKPIEYTIGRKTNRAPTAEEESLLARVVQSIAEKAKPGIDWVITNPAALFRRVDPESQQEEQVALCSFLEVALPEDIWQALEHLQETFGNISCESETRIMSVEEIRETGILGHSGQDIVLANFFLNHGLEPWELPTESGVEIDFMGSSWSSYQRYLERLDVKRTPPLIGA